MRRRPVTLLVLLAALLLGGCTSTLPGTPAPATTPAPDDQVITLPPRPRDVPLDGVDPCTLLTPDQRTALELDGEPLPYDDTSALTGPGLACTVSGLGRRDIGFAVGLTSAVGIEKFTTLAYAERGVRPIEIEGFPALLSPPPPTMPDNCLVLVDVAPGQVLSGLLSSIGLPGLPVDELCSDVPRYTAEAVRTLLAERPG